MAQNFKKAERKKQIKEAAIKLISEKGYKNTSVQDILDEINYSKSGFYHCYKSKDELFKDILNDSMENRYNSIRNAGNSIDRKSCLIESLLDKILDHNKYKKLFTTLIMELPNDEKYFEFYNERMKELTDNFLSFCDREGFIELKPLVSKEFNILLSSLIFGVEIFKQNDNEEYRNMLRKFFTLYFNEKGFFSKRS